jgi:hypothetical protein
MARICCGTGAAICPLIPAGTGRRPLGAGAGVHLSDLVVRPTGDLKGWIDRVFTRKFAFDFGPGGMKGLLTHEKALILNTLGGDEATYQQERWHELLVRPMVEGILGACGVDNVVAPGVLSGAFGLPR